MDLCVRVCSSASCALLEVPTCPTHRAMFCQATFSSSPTSAVCPCESCKLPISEASTCSECGNSTTLRAIGLDLDEVAYLRKVFPSAQKKFKHTLLFCPSCHVAGFPCTSSEFTTRTDDAAFSSGRGSMQQESWVPVTIHHPCCTSTALTNLPVTITRDTISTIITSHTPTLDAWMQWHPDARVNEFMVPAPKARRRSRPTAALSSQTKSIGLRFMTKLLSSIKVADEQRLVQLLRTVVSPLARAPPAALFAEWSPAASAAPFEATLAEASASHDNGDARKALHTAAGAWVCTSSALVTWWSAKLTTGTPAASASAEAVGHITQCLKVSRVDVIWEAVPEAKLIPRRCVLEVCTESAPWVVVAAPARFAPKQSFHIDPPVDATQLRLSLRGFADGNSARRHGIASVRVFVVRTTADVVTPSSTMDAITTVLSSIPPSGPSDALVDLSLSGLVSFVQASGSLTQLLSLLQALYDRGSAAADRQSEFSKGVVALLATISEATVALRDKIITQECYTPIAAPAASSSALVPVSVVFDGDKSGILGSQGTVELREGNMVASSVSGSHSVALLDRGFTCGKANWEIRLEEDTSSQCTCFGVATKPVRDCNYEKSKEMWLYRAYNGYKYSQGVCNSSSGPKINKGDTVRCELDMDAGSFQLFINGSPAATFTGLQGQEVFPAVQFYSSGRVVRLLSFEASGLGASAAVPITRLCTLEEVRAAVGYGVLGKAGDLGYAYQGNRKVVVASQAPLHSLSMHPPPNHDGKSFATVTYQLSKKYTRFAGAVALSDAVPVEKFRQQGSPVTFAIWADTRLLWSSELVTAPGMRFDFDVDLLEVEQLELRVQAEGKNKFCHAVWVDPTLTDCTDWSVAGWRNDKSSFVCEVTGTRRGKLPSLGYDPLALPPDWSFINIANTLLHRVSVLATQYSRSMKLRMPMPESGEAPVDLEAPFCIEVAAGSFSRLHALLEQNLKMASSCSEPDMTPCIHLLQLLRANIRRLDVANVDATKVLGTSLTSTQALLHTLCTFSGDVSAVASEILSSCSHVLAPSLLARAERLRTAVPGAGTLEIQFDFPAAPVALGDAEIASFDSVLLMLQLLCRDRQWPHVLIGRWPAKIYFIVEVPRTESEGGSLGLLNFLEFEWPALLATCGLASWTFPDALGMPYTEVKLERFPAFNRTERLLIEPSNMMRIYPDGMFCAVVAGLKAFVPPREI